MSAALYVYGLTAATDRLADVALGPGLAAQAVTLLPAGPLLAVVSRAPDQPIAGTRRNMLAHTAVLERVLAQIDVLPLRFGTIAPDPVTLHRGILSTVKVLSEALAAVAGRVELGVKATWRDDIAYREILEADPALRHLRDRLQTRPASQTYYERIELGRRVEAALADRRDAESAAILAELEPLAERVAVLKNLDDTMLLHRAFLVRRENEPRFDSAMALLAERFAARLDFRYVGPIPAYNFVTLRADWLLPHAAAA